jgi:hypothetical protein
MGKEFSDELKPGKREHEIQSRDQKSHQCLDNEPLYDLHTDNSAHEKPLYAIYYARCVRSV